MRKPLTLVTALVTSLFISGSFAATPKVKAENPAFVTAKQAMLVQTGQSKEEVIKMLGKPLAQPKWRNGTSSIIYKTEDVGSSNALLYIDIDTVSGKVIQTTIAPDEAAGTADSTE